MSNSVGSPSSEGDGQCGPYHTTAPQRSGTSLSYFRLALSPALQENSGNLDLCFGKSKTEKEERKEKEQEGGEKREEKKKKREGEREEGKHEESYLCSLLR